MRTASIARKTAETDIAVSLTLDGTGKASIATGVGFFDHMLELFARHGLFEGRARDPLGFGGRPERLLDPGSKAR